MWVVTVDRPYYPCVKYFSSPNSAREYAERELEEAGEDGGTYRCVVTVSKVEQIRETRTSY